MQSEDTYRLRLQQLVASIRAWTGFVADVARVEVTEVGEAWRVALTPKVTAGCPLELVLDGRRQHCDLRLGSETYEDWELPSLDVVLPLIEAVVDGRIVTRRTTSAATGLLLSTSTVVRLADGRTIEQASGGATGSGVGGASVECREVHYLPYRRGG